MSIRADICKTIFKRWTKRLEYRSRFNKDFKGVVFVYESGADGTHKVIGSFTAGHIVCDRADEDLSEADEKFLQSLDEQTRAQYHRIVDDTAVMYAIEITEVKRFTRPLSLREFSEFFGTSKNVERAPQSWQYAFLKNEDLEPLYTSVKPEDCEDLKDGATEKFFER